MKKILLLLCIAAFSSPVSAAELPVCQQSQFGQTLTLAGMGAIAMAAIIAVVYMLGEFFQNPRMINWSKTETMQVFVSLVIIAVLLFVLSTFCTVKAGEMGAIAGLVSTPDIFNGTHANVNIYNGSILYLENLAGISLVNMAQVRANLGSYEIRTSFTKFTCDSTCLYSLSSSNLAVFGGETMKLALTNNLLGTATISHLSILFQYFTLLYIANGLFLEFLPLALVIRSVPFMRQFGGALVAIFVSLYLLYPAMVVADAYIVRGFAQFGGQLHVVDRTSARVDVANGVPGAKLCAGADVFRTNGWGVDCDRSLPMESELEDKAGVSEDSMHDLPPSDFGEALKLNVLIFLSAVFLPALNFIIIAALARDLSHFLGEDADISRLGQMV